MVDEATRNVQVQATFANPQGKLRPGMFVEAKVVLGGSRDVVALPASAINYAPYGDSVFIVEQIQGPNGQSYRGARQQVVKLGGALGDQVAVLSGLEAGAEVVSSGRLQAQERRRRPRRERGPAGQRPGSQAGGQLKRSARMLAHCSSLPLRGEG